MSQPISVQDMLGVGYEVMGVG